MGEGITGTYFPLKWTQHSTDGYDDAAAVIVSKGDVFIVRRKRNELLYIIKSGPARALTYTRQILVPRKRERGQSPESGCDIPAMELLARAIEDRHFDVMWKEGC